MAGLVAKSEAQAENGSPTPEAVREQLERILSHPEFTASDRRKSFLRYVVEETLAGRADHLKGYSIAVSVLGRDDSFDPSADPVVRLEARRLRRELEHYYLTAGSGDPIHISVPKGAYVPTFEAGAEPAPVAPDPDESGPAAVRDPPSRRPTVVIAAAAALALAFAVGSVTWWWAQSGAVPEQPARIS
jgi:hypothetical protein